MDLIYRVQQGGDAARIDARPPTQGVDAVNSEASGASADVTELGTDQYPGVANADTQ